MVCPGMQINDVARERQRQQHANFYQFAQHALSGQFRVAVAELDLFDYACRGGTGMHGATRAVCDGSTYAHGMRALCPKAGDALQTARAFVFTPMYLKEKRVFNQTLFMLFIQEVFCPQHTMVLSKASA